MKISHEVPLDLLDNSLTFNDFDYILPHYYQKYPKYKEFMLRNKEKLGRFSILDNGLFEQEVLPEQELIEIIQELKPNIFVLPDAWNNSMKTFQNARYWLEKIKTKLPKETEFMVVAQGKSFVEMQVLIQDSLRLGINHFGMNHSSLAYTDLYYHPNPDISRMMGRIVTFNKLLEEDFYGKFKQSYIHFLGCTIPQELIYINNKQYIKSIDTTNPIINGIQGKKYTDLGCGLSKPQEKIEIYMEKDLAPYFEDIILNINKFREWSR